LTAIDRRATHLICLVAPLGAAILACSGRAVSIEVRASLSDSTPLAGVAITAFPYDPEQLLDSLAAADTVPRPDFSALEAELLAFKRPAPVGEDSTDRAWRATQDTARRLADSLRSVDRRSAGYGASYARFRQLYRRLMDRSGARDAHLRSLTADVRSLGERAGRAADSLRAWERTAFAPFDSLSAAAARATGRPPVTAQTDPDGWARFDLPPGGWWLVLRLPHPDNPFVQYAWDVPLVAAGLPFRVALTTRTARLVWRH